MTEPKSPEVMAFLKQIAAKGGKASGDCKRRSPEHYRKMVDARNAQRAAARAAAAKPA